MRLAITDLEVSFGERRVVNLAELTVGEAEIVGLAGDSGSGKSMTTLAVLGLAHTVGARVSGSIRLDGADQAMRQVLLPPGLLDRYPSQLSGGQLQRVAIALALALRAEVLLADEPTSALDVTVQAEVLELLRELRDRERMSVLFISHDLAVVAELCDRVAIMQHGSIVEQGPTSQVITAPASLYTAELLASVPRLAAGAGQ